VRPGAQRQAREPGAARPRWALALLQGQPEVQAQELLLGLVSVPGQGLQSALALRRALPPLFRVGGRRPGHAGTSCARIWRIAPIGHQYRWQCPEPHNGCCTRGTQ